MFSAQSTVYLHAVESRSRVIVSDKMAASTVPVAVHFIAAHYDGSDFTRRERRYGAEAEKVAYNIVIDETITRLWT